jgi:selenide,water dikinase
MAKAGVYAVRAGPLLDHSLCARLEDGSLRHYQPQSDQPQSDQPQSDFLSLLNLGDGTAHVARWGLVVRGRGVMWRKDRIDRAFMARDR